VKSPKEETWDPRDLRSSPIVAQQTHSYLLCHTGKQAWLLHMGDGSTAQKISAFPPKCCHQPPSTICSCPSALITLLPCWCPSNPAHHYGSKQIPFTKAEHTVPFCSPLCNMGSPAFSSPYQPFSLPVTITVQLS